MRTSKKKKIDAKETRLVEMFIFGEEMKTSSVGETAEGQGCIMSPESRGFAGTSDRKAARHWRVRPLGGSAPIHTAAACVLTPWALICPRYPECVLMSVCIVMRLTVCVCARVHAYFNLCSDKRVYPSKGKYACWCTWLCVCVCVLTHRLLLQPGECFNSECVGVFLFFFI